MKTSKHIRTLLCTLAVSGLAVTSAFAAQAPAIPTNMAATTTVAQTPSATHATQAPTAANTAQAPPAANTAQAPIAANTAQTPTAQDVHTIPEAQNAVHTPAPQVEASQGNIATSNTKAMQSNKQAVSRTNQ